MSASNLTNEELLELVRQRGLETSANTAPVTPSQPVDEFIMKLQSINQKHKDLISEAKSASFIPQGAKTALLDVAMDRLLRIEG